MPDPTPRPRPRALLGAIALSAVLGGAAGGGVAALLLREPRDRPVADAVAALAADGGEADRVAAVAAAVLPSVVRVDVRGIGAGEVEGAIGSSGNASGVLFDDEGHVVTNHHVVDGATSITVTFVDRTTATATLVGSDPANDVAVLRVADPPDLPPISLADPGVLQVGQLAVAVGSPYGLDGSVTAGIISAVDRPVDLRVPDGQVVRLPGVVQTDAGVNPGNSGGPLVDAGGRMIGLNSAVLSGDLGAGVGFAVPSGIVADVVADLIADGRAATPYLGLAGTTLDTAAAQAVEAPGGAVVDRVQAGSPADVAGLLPQDVVVAVDGVALAGMDDLVAAVRAAEVGATIVLDIVRDGTVQTVPVTLLDGGAQPAAED